MWGLPGINGLNDDRVKVLLNGMVATSACTNYMNPPLSYIDPSQVAVAVVTKVKRRVWVAQDSLRLLFGCCRRRAYLSFHPLEITRPDVGFSRAKIDRALPTVRCQGNM